MNPPLPIYILHINQILIRIIRKDYTQGLYARIIRKVVADGIYRQRAVECGQRAFCAAGIYRAVARIAARAVFGQRRRQAQGGIDVAIAAEYQ